MDRNDTFDISRFGKYLLYELKDTARAQGLPVLLTGLAPVMLFLIHLLFSLTGEPEGQTIVWENYSGNLAPFYATAIFTLFFLIFPISRYGKMTDKRNGTQFFMLPVSSAEKFVSALLVSAVVVPVAFMILYFFSDWIIHAAFPGKVISSLAGLFFGTPLTEFNEAGSYYTLNCSPFIFLPIAISMAGLAGAAAFRKNKIFMTIIVCLLLCVTALWATVHAIDNIDTEKWESFLESGMADVTWHGIQFLFAIICAAFAGWKMKKIQL